MGERPSMRHSSTKAAVGAVRRGYQPIPILDRGKAPGITAWTHLRWNPVDLQDVADRFDEWAEKGSSNIGLALGEPSGGLVDIDLDHAKTTRLKDHFLPRTAMRSGRAGRPNSHYWYIVEGSLPGTRRYKMGDGSVSVELRSTGAQTVIPPSIHPSGEDYRWEGRPWGGKEGPTRVDGRVLAVQVALLGLGAALIEKWPGEGGRHDAYLALAGGLLRYGHQGVHPYWERNLPVLIRALAAATNDEDGATTREAEVMKTTLAALRGGGRAVGFPSLAEILGEQAVSQVRRMAREVEALAGFVSKTDVDLTGAADDGDLAEQVSAAESEAAALPLSERDPLGERLGTWQPVNLEPYLAGEVVVPEPTVLRRDDGQALMYGGRVNMLYGSSESAKSWLALTTCIQEMANGERVMYLDFEDEPVQTLSRLLALGAGPDDIRLQFSYIRPEEPLAPMQRNRWGAENTSEAGTRNLALFMAAVEAVDPTLIVADGMTVLYGLHGLDSNDAVSTDVITGWLKKLTRNGRTTVIVIDHTTKSADKGSLPIGSQHKVAMVQGSMLQVWPVRQPMPGAVGEVELVVLKDRPGQVRAISATAQGKAQVSAVVTLDSREEGKTRVAIGPPPSAAPGSPVVTVDLQASRDADRARRAAEWEERIKWTFGGDLDLLQSMPDILAAVASFGNEAAARAAVKRLVEQGWLRAEGNTRGRRYALQIGAAGYEDGDDPT